MRVTKKKLKILKIVSNAVTKCKLFTKLRIMFVKLLSRCVKNWVGAWGLVPHASSHTTVQAVPCFDNSEGMRLVVFGHQLPNIALAYPLIPSYFRQVASLRSNWLIGNRNFQLLIRCTVWSFPIGTRALGTMTSADCSRQALLHDFRKGYLSPRPWDLLR